MLCLAFELSSPQLSVAVARGDLLLSQLSRSGQRQHAETLVPMIEEALQAAGVAREELELIAVGRGPGSFTGIRMAVTAAKILAAFLPTRLIAASSLEIMHEAYREQNELHLPCLDARGGRIYAALYRGSEILLPEGKYEASELWPRLATYREPIWLEGSGQAALLAMPDGEEKFRLGREGDRALEAGELCRLAARLVASQEFTDPATLEAQYCSLSQAERLRLEGTSFAPPSGGRLL